MEDKKCEHLTLNNTSCLLQMKKEETISSENIISIKLVGEILKIFDQIQEIHHNFSEGEYKSYEDVIRSI